MTDQTDPQPPTVPPRVRTVTYFAGLGVAAGVLLVTGMATIWAPDYSERILASGGVVTSVMLLVTGGLGVAYRPR